MNGAKRGLVEAELGRLSDRGCIFLAIKVTAEVDESSSVLGIPVDDFESAFRVVGWVLNDFADIRTLIYGCL